MARATPVSAQTVWSILHAEGLERLGRRRSGGPRRALDPVKARALSELAGGARLEPCDHAGLYLLMPAMAELGLDALVSHARYPSTKVLSSFHSLGVAPLVKCSPAWAVPPTPSRSAADPGLGLLLGLSPLPKATHLTSYSYRVKRSSNVALLEVLGPALRRGRPLLGRGRVQLGLPRHPPPRRRGPPGESTTCRHARSAPARCSPSSPRTTPRPRWSTPTPT